MLISTPQGSNCQQEPVGLYKIRRLGQGQKTAADNSPWRRDQLGSDKNNHFLSHTTKAKLAWQQAAWYIRDET